MAKENFPEQFAATCREVESYLLAHQGVKGGAEVHVKPRVLGIPPASKELPDAVKKLAKDFSGRVHRPKLDTVDAALVRERNRGTVAGANMPEELVEGITIPYFAVLEEMDLNPPHADGFTMDCRLKTQNRVLESSRCHSDFLPEDVGFGVSVQNPSSDFIAVLRRVPPLDKFLDCVVKGSTVSVRLRARDIGTENADFGCYLEATALPGRPKNVVDMAFSSPVTGKYQYSKYRVPDQQWSIETTTVSREPTLSSPELVVIKCKQIYEALLPILNEILHGRTIQKINHAEKLWRSINRREPK